MDGYAVLWRETVGATRDRPARFQRVGVSYAGTPSDSSVTSGRAVRIFTGAKLPTGADCVVDGRVVIAAQTATWHADDATMNATPTRAKCFRLIRMPFPG
jgi:molybdopterin biosynthesis enzyme